MKFQPTYNQTQEEVSDNLKSINQYLEGKLGDYQKQKGDDQNKVEKRLKKLQKFMESIDQKGMSDK